MQVIRLQFLSIVDIQSCARYTAAELSEMLDSTRSRSAPHSPLHPSSWLLKLPPSLYHPPIRPPDSKNIFSKPSNGLPST